MANGLMQDPQNVGLWDMVKANYARKSGLQGAWERQQGRQQARELVGSPQQQYQMGEAELFPGETQAEAIQGGLPVGTPIGQQISAPQGLMTKGTGLVGGEITPSEFYGGLLSTPGYKGIGAQGLMGAQQIGTTPSAVREYKYWKNLPEKEQAAYMGVKRAQKFLDIGSGFVAPSQVDPTMVKDVVKKELKPSEIPSYIAKKKDVAIKQAAQSGAQVSLGKSQIQYDKNKQLISGILNHPGLNSAFGVSSYAPVIRGTERAGFEAQLEQLKNTVFITNREALKGGGSITDYEGNKAEEAELRANNAQSAEEFKKAMTDYEYWVDRGFEQLKRTAKGDFSLTPTKKRLNKQNESALKWARENPKDPRAALILKKLGVK